MSDNGALSSADTDSWLAKYTASTVSQAPENVGLYAWYAVLPAGRKDYEVDISEGRDLGVERLRNLLQRYTTAYTEPPMPVQARTRFFGEWSGQIRDLFSAPVLKALAGEAPEDDERTSKLMITLENPTAREQLVHVLSNATPFLSAPIYVGVSDNLRRRLSKHVSQLHKAHRAIREDPDARERFRTDLQRTSFGVRAASMGFSADNLEVWTMDLSVLLPIAGHEAPNAKRRDVAEVAEWLINRWNKPLLGRR